MKNANALGLLLGSCYAVGHAGWAVLVATNTARPLLDWLLDLHFLRVEYAVQPFEIGRAATLVVVTFVCGYFLGWFLGIGWGMVKK